MALSLEEKRFISYQDIYRSTPIPQPPQAAPSTPTSKATKTMQSRRSSYGPKGQSAESVTRAQNANKNK